jgi:acetyl-CoA carboxylase/biotin carboxylase 1
MDWLAYVPDKKGSPVPISPGSDNWDRDIEYMPPQKNPYDVRWLIAGKEDEEGFLPGLFDKGSFQETLSGWARTVVVGRARLGGIPVGIIGVETRSIENVTPADPANPDSTEQVTHEAGQVWYPNSAFKTAQAINDFNHGEQLPLVILANWRGFSGGQRDMYNEVLKYGSYIVDALVKYKQPIFVYIPPFGELRGGSWVVVDPTINPDMMEMYADEESRGGVLEPEGIVGIKFRRDKQLDAMSRLDPAYGDLKRSLANKELTADQIADIKVKMTEREKLLMPVYSQISLQFADLHDRAGRMKAKGTIREQLQWRGARRFLYWRLRRRLTEEYILKKMIPLSKTLTRQTALEQLKSWYGGDSFETNDHAVALWYEENNKNISAKLDEIKHDGAAKEVAAMLRHSGSFKEGVLKGLAESIHKLTEEEKNRLREMLQ